MITKIPATIPDAPQKLLPVEKAHAAQPNDSAVSSVTKIRWKAFSDILVSGGSGRKIIHREHRQAHQPDEKNHRENEDGIDHFFLGQQVHEITGDEKGVHDGDGENHRHFCRPAEVTMILAIAVVN